MIPVSFIAAGVAAAIGFGAAWQIQSLRADSAALSREMNARAAERIRRQNTETAATGYEAARIEIRETFVPITERIESVVTKIEYRDRVCFDDDGVRAANAALRGSPERAGEPRGPLPAAPPAP